MKKQLIFCVCLSIGMPSAFAQEYKTNLTNSKDHKVTIEMEGGEIKVEGHNGDGVVIIASSGYENIVPPERAKGLKPLYNSAVDNTGIGLSVTPSNGGLTIEKATRKAVSYTIRLPKNVAVLYQQLNWQGAGITINNMDGDLEVRTNNAKIDLNRVTGPVVANTISGEISVVYSGLNQEKPTAISTISGVIDITLPPTAKSNLKLRTITGEVYTDFDLGVKQTKDGMAKVGGNSNVYGATNGGGVEMQFKTFSSNIYIRKQK